jgi:hypothetical protein
MAKVGEGHPHVLDMLFAPPWAWVGEPDPLWRTILEYRSRMLSRSIVPIFDYCRGQCAKYGLKGTRITALRTVLAALDRLCEQGHDRSMLCLHRPFLEEWFAGMDMIGFEEGGDPSGRPSTLLTVSDKSVPLTCSVHRAVPVFRGALAKYGHRAHAAETNQGIDWKAVMHAVRVGTQTIELLETGTITFPRPDATFLLTVVKGEHPYREVAARIESLMTEVEEAAARSPLPEKPDFAMMDLLVANAYQEEARKASVHDLASRIVDLRTGK